jgi:GT2 family glycosyltransferase
LTTDSRSVAVSVVLWRPDLRTFRWACDGLRASVPLPDLLRVHVNEAADDALLVDVREIAAGAATIVEVTSSPDNRGFAGGHNDVLAACFERGATAVLVLNPDVRVSPGALAKLVEQTSNNARRLVGPLIELADPTTLLPEGRIDSAGIVWTRSGRHLDHLQGRPLADAPTATVHVRGLTGACLLVSDGVHRTLLETCGEFLDADFLAYREDADLGLRAAALGIEQLVVPQARALHVRTQRGTQRGSSDFVDYLGVRNRFLLAFKHGRRRPGGLSLAPVRDLVVIAGVLVKERSSLPGLRDAWRLRKRMRAKGRRLRSAATEVTQR